MDFERIRRMTITALFSDDELFDRIVLKGGNAMRLVHGIGGRTSLDLDFSMEGDFEDLVEMQRRMERALERGFAGVRLVPFDVKLQPRPSNAGEVQFPSWGGYELSFKLVDESRFERFRTDLERLRREAAVVGPNQLRIFTADFSKCEYTAGKLPVEMDSYTVYVYTLEMIALEKRRAICQQMEEYVPIGRTRRPRARDFYDINAIVTRTGFRFDAPGAAGLLRAIFDAQQVPLRLLGRIASQREFHRADWASVRSAAIDAREDFDYYFDFVLAEVQRLHSLWME